MRMKEALEKALADGRPCLIVQEAINTYRVEQLPNNVVAVVDNGGFPTALDAATYSHMNSALNSIMLENRQLRDKLRAESVEEDEAAIAEVKPKSKPKRVKVRK